MSRLLYILSRLLNKRPAAIINSVIDPKAKVGDGAQIVNSRIGRYSYVYGSQIIHTRIGSFCSIAGDCTIGGGKHPVSWVSSSPVFYEGKNVFNKHFSNNKFEEYAQTLIGNDVWIGSKSLIKGGVVIGDGAIVGMGSVVTHDIPPYEIWGGNPAHFIKKRFDDESIQRLMDICWWDAEESVLFECGDLFSDVEALLEFFNKKMK